MLRLSKHEDLRAASPFDQPALPSFGLAGGLRVTLFLEARS